MTGQSVDGFLCLNGESEAYRMGTHCDGSLLRIVIDRLAGDGFRYIGATSTALSAAKTEQTVMGMETQARAFAREVWREFSKIDVEWYETNWFPFPRLTFDALTDYIKYRAL